MNEADMVKEPNPIIGTTVNSLKVLADSGTRHPNGEVMYECECLECGKHVKIRSYRLHSGKARNCGCKKKQTRGKIINRIVVDLGEVDADIYEHIKTVPNRTQYIKDLIRNEIKSA